MEAAQAGEQGRGFAVVATEVRSLAQRGVVAAKEISLLIVDSVEKVTPGNLLVTEAGQTMDRVVASVKDVTGIVGEIATASKEQRDGIERVNRAIAQMDEITQQNATLVQEAAAAARSLLEHESHLVGVVGVFKINGQPTQQSFASQPTIVADSSHSMRQMASYLTIG